MAKTAISIETSSFENIKANYSSRETASTSFTLTREESLDRLETLMRMMISIFDKIKSNDTFEASNETEKKIYSNKDFSLEIVYTIESFIKLLRFSTVGQIMWHFDFDMPLYSEDYILHLRFPGGFKFWREFYFSHPEDKIQ